MKYKVDIIIPIYNSLEWLKLCIKALFTNTNYDILGKVYLIDDCSEKNVIDFLKIIQRKYGDMVEVIRNKKNQGFVKNCNKGMKISKNDFVLLLNTDCILSKNAIEKMANNMSKDKKIGLMCPISSVAANLSYSIPEGLSFMKVNEIFENQFKGKIFDACTVVGNCLMISRDCINKVGYFDEIYEKGYTEETDYQFKALKKGFKAKVTIDTYVYHECRVSFGESKKQLDIRAKHLEIFFNRYGKEYNRLMEKYQKNNPIDYINKNINYNDLKFKNIYEFKKKDKNIQNLVNYFNQLIIDGFDIQFLTKNKKLLNYNGIILFNPKDVRKFKL